MIDFLAEIWGPLDGLYGEIRSIKDGHAQPNFYRSPETAFQSASLLDSTGHDVYFGVLPRTQRRGRAEDCTKTTHVLWLDLDAKQFGDSKSKALHALTHLDVHPSIITDSGHGYHAYYILRKPVLFEKAQKVMKGLVAKSGADPKATDAPRILRIPGTHNYKGDESVPVRLLYFDPGNRHHLSDFAPYVQEPEERVVGGNGDLSALASNYDIVEALTLAGAQMEGTGNIYMGQCLFHDDHTPSMAAYPDTQSFYCFGCGAWGDALNLERWKATGRLHA